jgi:exopolyphosphatase/guanosine-5'-triphosphate,3'-diphosphate pyrophosphatase
MLERKDARQRREIAGLSPERADIIIAGVTLVDELMRFFGANLLRINERGIREGLILKSLDDLGLVEKREARRDWRTVVREFARSCHSDEGHAETVRDLSLQIFDGTAALHGLDERARQLLEAAALLHDVGYFIDYAKHHKHSYHLIRHAGLFGFTPREQEVVANLARYHRKSLPRKKHENFALLSAEDQQLVRQLGGILRLADGLDRCRSGNLQRITAELTEKTCTLLLQGKGDLGVELYGGQNKGDLFELAFGRRLALKLADD